MSLNMIGRSVLARSIYGGISVPVRELAYVSNKRITRLESDVRVDKSELKSTGNERYLDVNVRNRNPRNLEQMLLQPKPMGFELDSPNRHFWNKVIFEKKAKFLSARIVHHSGETIVQATSNEAPIAQYLNSPLGLKAAQILGQVLARRALESGIHAVFSDQSSSDSSKAQAFLQSFSETGIDLQEQSFIFTRSNVDH